MSAEIIVSEVNNNMNNLSFPVLVCVILIIASLIAFFLRSKT